MGRTNIFGSQYEEDVFDSHKKGNVYFDSWGERQHSKKKEVHFDSYKKGKRMSLIPTRSRRKIAKVP